MGMCRSLLHQILQQDHSALQDFLRQYIRKKETEITLDFREGELRGFISSILCRRTATPICLVIDALDECDEQEVRAVVEYLRELTDHAFTAGKHMSVCMSSRRYPTISVARCPEIAVEEGNRSDVSKYVHRKIRSHADGSIPESLAIAVDSKASNVFLWAVLIVEILLRQWDNGASVLQLEVMLHQIPREMEQVFHGLVDTITSDERPESVRLFQWVLYSVKPLRFGSLEYALIFGADTPPPSFKDMHELNGSFDARRSIRRITHFSRGLIEVVNNSGNRSSSTVQVIHESVRDWFLKNDGFARLEVDLGSFSTGKSQLQIVKTCLSILSAHDFCDMHLDWQDLEGTYWCLERFRDGKGPGLSAKEYIVGITRYCVDYISLTPD